MEKLPPLEKIYEAYSVLVDKRIAPGDGEATISSSNGAKTYTVTWDDEGIYTSDDSATYWQGYAGYPVIAVLMLQGILPYDESIAKLFSGVDWTILNKKFKRDYSEAVSSIFEEKNVSDGQRIQAKEEAQKILSILSDLDITLKRKRSQRTPSQQHILT